MKIIEFNGKRKIVKTVFTESSLTDQSQKAECDVNNIMAKYLKTGQISHINGRQPNYADVSEVKDLQTMTIKVKEAQEAFNALPAKLREKLNNDPVKMIEYLNNPENDDEAVEFGLKARRQYTAGSKQAEGAQGNAKAKNESAPQTTTINDDDKGAD